jgi:uncharacterized protein (TIGR02246 family)
VNIRGELHSGAQAIGAGHQGIFDSIYKGSTVDLSLVRARELRDGEILAHVSGKLHVPEGPLAGDHEALGTVVLVPAEGEHRIAAYHNTLVVG